MVRDWNLCMFPAALFVVCWNVKLYVLNGPLEQTWWLGLEVPDMEVIRTAESYGYIPFVTAQLESEWRDNCRFDFYKTVRGIARSGVVGKNVVSGWCCPRLPSRRVPC